MGISSVSGRATLAAFLAFGGLGLSASAARAQAEANGVPTAQPKPAAAERSRPADDSKASAKPSTLLEIGLMAALDRARSAYQNGRYDQCVASYGELLAQGEELEAQLAADALEQARTYYAACLLAQDQPEAADAQFRAALERNPLMAAPDPVLFPGQVRDLFFKVKADFLEDIRRVQEEQLAQAKRESEARLARARQERERVRQLELAASTESVVSVNRRWVASVPFGVGQFQNGDTLLGGVFLGSELLMLGACITAVAVELNTHAQAAGGRAVYPSAEPFNDRLYVAHVVELAAGAGFVGLALIGIAQAHMAFVPEVPRGRRPHSLPSSLRPAQQAPVDVDARVSQDGAWLSVSGRF